MSFSFAKLKSYLPGQTNSSTNAVNGNNSSFLEPEIGFQLALESTSGTTTGNSTASGTTSSGGNIKGASIDSNIPSLNVHLISARHLPTLFGFKTVQGYQIKVKLFPGSKRYDSSIQTCTWPKYDETFRFPLEPDIKPSIKNYSKEKQSDNLPEKLCSGHFVVFTVYALLELPPGTFNRFKGTYRSLREKGNNLLKNKSSEGSNNNDNKQKETKDNESKSNKKQEKLITPGSQQLTQSESKRNIGSVTCFLDSKIFKYNNRTGRYVTDELWLPIKDITVTPSKPSTSNSMINSTKGQIELVLELCDSLKDDIVNNDVDNTENDVNNTKKLQKEKSLHTPSLKKQWSLTEMKRKIKTSRTSSKDTKELYLKVTTSKMRCSIKVKDEFENSAEQIYVKTSIFENDILSNSWKCDNFLPSLSTRWDSDKSTIIIPITNEEILKNILIKTTVATKTKIGKKIILGTVLIGSQVNKGSGSEHWNAVLVTRNEAIAKWHGFQ